MRWLAPERLRLLGALSGLGFVVAAAASRLVAPVPVLPEIDGGGLVRSYYLNYRAGLTARGVLWGVASILAVAFLAVLASQLQQSSVPRWLSTAVLGAGVAALASSSLSTAALTAVMEYRQDEVLGATGGDSGGAVALFELYEATERLSGYPAAALLVFVSLAALRGDAVALGGQAWPRWFGWAGLAAAVLLVLAAAGVEVTWSGSLTHVAFLAWTAAASALLADRRPGSGDATPQEAADAGEPDTGP